MFADPQCNCPKRPEEVPPLPTQLPPGLTATEKDIPALKEWILDYYASTTFNVCEHQPLPMMKCEPLKLFLNPEARPVAVHKPAKKAKQTKQTTQTTTSKQTNK